MPRQQLARFVVLGVQLPPAAEYGRRIDSSLCNGMAPHGLEAWATAHFVPIQPSAMPQNVDAGFRYFR
jgi:hypothetical protein